MDLVSVKRNHVKINNRKERDVNPERNKIITDDLPELDEILEEGGYDILGIHLPTKKGNTLKKNKKTGQWERKEGKGRQTKVLVAFKTAKRTKQKIVIGPAVEYIVVRWGGRDYYKEKTQVVFLPEGWKDGDPIPPLP